MKTNQKKQTLTFGDLIESSYRSCGKRRARGMIRMVAKSGVVVFQGHGPYLIS